MTGERPASSPVLTAVAELHRHASATAEILRVVAETFARSSPPTPLAHVEHALAVVRGVESELADLLDDRGRAA